MGKEEVKGARKSNRQIHEMGFKNRQRETPMHMYMMETGEDKMEIKAGVRIEKVR